MEGGLWGRKRGKKGCGGLQSGLSQERVVVSTSQPIATRNPQPTPPHRSRGPEDGIFGWPDERREGIGKGKAQTTDCQSNDFSSLEPHFHTSPGLFCFFLFFFHIPVSLIHPHATQCPSEVISAAGVVGLVAATPTAEREGIEEAVRRVVKSPRRKTYWT